MRIRGRENQTSQGYALKNSLKPFGEKEMAISRKKRVALENKHVREHKRELYDGEIGLRSPSRSELPVTTT
jgi:hypothetical protein